MAAQRPGTTAEARWPQAVALGLGLVGLVLSAVGAAEDPGAFLRAYLIAELVWLAVPLGCLVLLLAYHLMGGRWGLVLGDVLEAAARTLPLLALLFVPLLFFLDDLFPWAREASLQHHHVVEKKTAYLNEPFFIGRAALYWVVWVALAFALTAPPGHRPAAERPRRRGLAAVGAILYAPTVSFAAIDWLMSLQPTFYSSAFGMYVMSIQALVGFAFVVAVIAVTEEESREPLLRERQLIGLGSILLSLVLLWVYFAYMQYLVIWSSNTPHHAEWYVSRGEGPWSGMYWAIALLGGALPIVVLLSSVARESWRAVGALTVLILATHMLEIVWVAAPAYGHGQLGLPPVWLVAAAIAAVGGLWLAAFLWQLPARAGRIAAHVAEVSRG